MTPPRASRRSSPSASPSSRGAEGGPRPRRPGRARGPGDICVNNAGMIYTVGQLKDLRDEDWEFNLAVNLTGTMKVTRAVFPGMRERRWGRIVCMASVAGLMGG